MQEPRIVLTDAPTGEPTHAQRLQRRKAETVGVMVRESEVVTRAQAAMWRGSLSRSKYRPEACTGTRAAARRRRQLAQQGRPTAPLQATLPNGQPLIVLA